MACGVGGGFYISAMPDARKHGKVKVNVWMTEDEKAQLIAVAEAKGFSSLTEFLKWVADQNGDGISENPNQGPPVLARGKQPINN